MRRGAVPFALATSLFCSGLGLGPAARGAVLHFIEGDLGDGYAHLDAFDVSGDGSVVVGGARRSVDDRFRAFRWTAAGGLENLGTLPGWESASAQSISRDGQVIGVDAWNGNVGPTQAARWTRPGGLVPLAPPAGGIGFSRFARPNADGSVIAGTWVYDDAFHDRVYRWTQTGGAVGLPLPPGTNDAFHSAVSDSGQVVVGRVRMTETGDAERAAVWRGESVQIVPGAEGAWSGATAVSADGSVIAGIIATAAEDGMQPFVWTDAGGLVRLANPAEGVFAHPSDMSADGSVIVGNLVSNIGYDERVFVWDAEHGMRGLTEILNAAGVDTTDVRFSTAWGVSSDGRTIVGVASRNDQVIPFVAVVPEPSAAIGLMALAIVAAVRRPRGLPKR